MAEDRRKLNDFADKQQMFVDTMSTNGLSPGATMLQLFFEHDVVICHCQNKEAFLGKSDEAVTNLSN